MWTYRWLLLSVVTTITALVAPPVGALPVSPSCPLPLAPLAPLSAPRHDGQRRLVARCPTANEGTSGRTTVAAYADGRQGADWAAQTLEEVAQALSGRGVTVVEVNLNTCSHLKHVRGVAAGSLLVYHRNRTYQYQGLRSTDALVAFVRKVRSDVVTVINSKAHKKAFDKAQDGPRLVALLQPGSPGLEEFQQAAAALHPYVSCSLLPNPKVLGDGEAEAGTLKDLKDKAPGTIAYYAPYEETPQLLPEGTADEILRFFSEGQLSFLRRLNPYDMYATMDLYKSSGRLVLAFLLPRTPEGLTLYKVLRRLANSNTVNDLKVNVLYINMEDFPLNICALEEEFGVDLDKPVMGLINITTGQASWFSKPDLHYLDKEQQTQEVAKWMTRVADGQVRVDGAEPAEETDTTEEKTETKEEKPETKQEDGDFQPDEDEDKDEKEDDDEKSGTKDEREKESTTPTEGRDKDDDDDDEDKDDKKAKKEEDDGDEGEEEKADKPVSHKTSHAKQSAYMRQFNDGEKIFTTVFRTVFGPVLDIFGVKVSSEDQKHAESSAKTKPKVVPVEKEVPTKAPSEPPVTSSHSKDKSVHKKYCEGSGKPFTALFRFVLSSLGLSSDSSSSHAEPQVTSPKSDKKTQVEDGDKQTEKPAKIHFGKSNDKYKSEESDKLLTNIIKGGYNIITMPLQMFSSESKEKETVKQAKHKETHETHEKPKHHVKTSNFQGGESDKLMTNILKTIFHPIISVVNNIRGEGGASESPKKEAEMPKKADIKHVEKPQKAQKAQKAQEKKKADKKTPVMKATKETKKTMPAYGGEDDKLISGLFKSAMNLVSGGTQKKEEVEKPAPVKETSKPKPKKQEKQKKVHKKPKTKVVEKPVPPKTPKKEKEPVQEKTAAPKERVVVPGKDGKDKYMSKDDKIFVSLVNMVKSVVAPETNGDSEEKDQPIKEKAEKSPSKEESSKPKEIKKEKHMHGKKLKAPKGMVPKDKPLPPIKKIAFGDESDKLITTLVRNVISTVKHVVGASENGESKPVAQKETKQESKQTKETPKPYRVHKQEKKEKAKEPEKIKEEKIVVEEEAEEVEAKPETTEEKEESKAEPVSPEPHLVKGKMPQYGGEDDKLLTNVFKAVYGLGQNAISQFTAHSVQAGPVGRKPEEVEEPKEEEEDSKEKEKPAPETPSPAKEKPKAAQEEPEKIVKQKAKPKPKRVYKPVPVPSFKEEGKAKSSAYDRYKASDDDKLISSTIKFIVSTVKNILSGNFKLSGKQAKEEVDDGDSLKPQVVLSEKASEAQPQEEEDNSLPKAEALNTIFKEESYGTQDDDEEELEVVVTETDKEEQPLSEETLSEEDDTSNEVPSEQEEDSSPDKEEGQILEEVFEVSEEGSEDFMKAAGEGEEEEKEETPDVEDDKTDIEEVENKEDTSKSDEEEDEDDKMTHPDFLHEAFKEEKSEEEVDGESPSEDVESLQVDITEPDSAEETSKDEGKNDDDDDDDNDDDENEKDDDMSTDEDFISMAFTDEDSKKQDLFSTDHDDDDELDDKDLNYLPFSEDPRKEFLYANEDQENEAQNEDEALYEHGKAYDRHRQGRQRL